MKAFIAFLSGFILLAGFYKRLKSYKKPAYYKSCAITAIVFSATAIGYCLIEDYSVINPVWSVVTKKYGGIFTVLVLFVFTAAHLNNYFCFTSINFNFINNLFYSLMLSIPLIVIGHYSDKLFFMLITTCLFFVIGVIHNFAGPLISAYTIATLVWMLYFGKYNIPSLLSLWPNFFDFFNIESKPLEYTVMVVSLLFGMSDFLQELPDQLA